MPDDGQDPGGYDRAVEPLDQLLETWGQAGSALVDAHWYAAELLVLEAVAKAIAIRVTPRGLIDRHTVLRFEVAAVLNSGDLRALEVPAGSLLERHLRVIYQVAGPDEFEDDHQIHREE